MDGDLPVLAYVIIGIITLGIAYLVGGPGLIKDVKSWWARIRH